MKRDDPDDPDPGGAFFTGACGCGPPWHSIPPGRGSLALP